MNKSNLSLTLFLVQGIVITFGSSMEMIVPIKSPDLAEMTANIIKSCYDDSVRSIGVTGNVSDSFVASMSSGNPISTIFLNDDESLVETVVVSEMSRHKLEIFAFTATSSLGLEKMIVFIKNSKWWNHLAKFYLFDSSDKEIGCAKASDILWRAWTMDILGAKFICSHDIEGPLIYTFNPYSQNAPAPWKIDQTRKGTNNHPWTLFVRKLDENMNICETIDFDPTRDPSGFELRMTMLLKHKVQKKVKNTDEPREFINLKFGDEILKTISRYMNVSLKMVYQELNETSGFVDTAVNCLLEDLTNGRSDVVFHVMPFTAVPQVVRNYPILDMRIFAVTQYTGYQTQWRKIISAIDGVSRIGLCIVILVNIFFLRYTLRQSFGIAILNTLRIICNSCFTKLPQSIGPRMYLACLFGFAVTMQALYQGQLSASLTKRVRYPNVNNAKDLMKSDHVLYGRYQYGTIFNDPVYKGRFVGIDDSSNKCINYIFENSSIACVGLRHWLVYDAIEAQLHMSNYAVGEIIVM